ncbi:cutinase family protein [Nocardia paucivorans]|uniref:cutinase family protein n=1 Tax=Nocardia paucivorans TaxID=114259 RepID=UPI0006862C55|nr:cutinase family protein [Nocardia paucivorans]
MKDVGNATPFTVRALAVMATASLATVSGILPPNALGDSGSPAATESGDCPELFVLGVQGTGQSSPNSPITVDSGMLATVLRPLAEIGHGRVIGRAYVPYPASFGGAVGDTTTPYSASALEGLRRLREMAAAVTERCPRTLLGIIGYSQGAHVVSMFAREVGREAGAVAADRIAAVALVGDPTRAPGAPIFPGRPGRVRPDPAPGTTGAAVDELPTFVQRDVPGGGIGPLRDTAPDFGVLSGRVASLCLPGDLACDAPPEAPLLHMIVDILGQAELLPWNPPASLGSLSRAFSATLARATATIVNHDLDGYSLGTLSLTPQKPLSVRLAEAADPRAGDDFEAHRALLRLGTLTLNTLLALIDIALTPDEVARIAAAPDPLTGLERTTTALVTAARRPLPHATASELLTQVFDALGSLIVDNAELLDPMRWLRYADTGRRHSNYPNIGLTDDGRTATDLIRTWFAAVGEDLADHRLDTPQPPPRTEVPPTPAPVSPAPPPPPAEETPATPAPPPPPAADSTPTRTSPALDILRLASLLVIALCIGAGGAIWFARRRHRTR